MRLVIATVVAAGVAGCAGGSSSSDAPRLTPDLEVALFWSHQSGKLGSGSGGVLELFGEADDVLRIEHGGMDNGAVAWGADGVYFADADSDYTLTLDDLVVTPHRKPDYLTAATLDARGRHIAIYNEGGSPMQYTQILVTRSGLDSTSVTTEGIFDVIAVCEGEILGVSQATGVYRGLVTDVDKDFGDLGVFSSDVLTRLDAPEPGPDALVGHAPPTGASIPGAVVPCADGVLHYLGLEEEHDGDVDESDPAVERLVLFSWDIRTGDRTVVALSGGDGQRVAGAEGSQGILYDGAAVSGSELFWYHPDGSVYATDLRSAETRAAFDTGVAAPDGDVLVEFDGDTVWLLKPGGGSALILWRFSLSSGEGEVVREIESPKAARSGGMILRDFAVSPDLVGGTTR